MLASCPIEGQRVNHVLRPDTGPVPFYCSENVCIILHAKRYIIEY